MNIYPNLYPIMWVVYQDGMLAPTCNKNMSAIALCMDIQYVLS